MAEPRPAPLLFALAFASGGLLTLMVLFNGQMAEASTPLFSSLAAHGLGTVAAVALITALVAAGRMDPGRIARPAPVWAWTGGLSGAVTVMLTSVTVNSALALAGTLALGLLGQVVFGLATDRFGLFGLPRRPADGRDLAALVLILAGSALIVFAPGT